MLIVAVAGGVATIAKHFSSDVTSLPFPPAAAVSSQAAKTGIASYYGLHPKREHLNPDTAMNIPFCPHLLEAAMWDIPLGSVVEVTNIANGRKVWVRITDRGPARRLGRLIDLTAYAFSQIASLRRGLIKVRVRVVYEKR